MHRNTYVEINLNSLSNNIKKIINTIPKYQYYFGIVKADGYGHGIEIVKALLNSGINYLAVATLDEALEIRENFSEIPILCLGYIPIEYLDLCVMKNITVTVPTIEYAEEIVNKNVKCHIKINTGMNRLGISTKEEYVETYNLLKDKIEGVYTHIYNATSVKDTEKQIDCFENIVTNKEDISIIHICASEAIFNHKRRDYENGCRLGIVMYGLIDTALNLESTFKLVSEIIQIHDLKPGEKLGYGGTYQANENQKIGVVSIGYADGIIRKNSGRNVYIHGKSYPIVGRICMDMLFVRIDDTISLHDKVEIIKDKEHICDIANYLDTIPYEVICSIGKRVPRVWKEY